MPEAMARGVRRAHTKNTELIASNSQNTKSVIMSPANTAPSALPT